MPLGGAPFTNMAAGRKAQVTSVISLKNTIRNNRKQNINVVVSSKNVSAMSLENLGIDPGTSRMQSGRCTIWAFPPQHITYFENHEESYCDCANLGIYMIYSTVSSLQYCAVISYMIHLQESMPTRSY